MKLTKGKLVETLRRKNEGWTTYQARKIAGISVRRVNQVWTLYNQTGRVPDLGKKVGRPAQPPLEEEEKIVKETYTKYRVSASTLEKVIERDYSQHIPHNRIHKIMLKLGLAKPKSKKDVRKKDWIRYERRHSLTAVHIDWHQRQDGNWVHLVEDDASRAILSILECQSPTTEESIVAMEEALTHGQIKQCISDHGSQYTTNNDGKSHFKEWLDAQGIKQILGRIKHPQTNGKVEKLFDTYEHHRDAFQTPDDYKNWYNHIRPHTSLDLARLETPWQAFQRKMRKK